jgi:outer membrane receptor protein involved in Fe transport
VQSDLPAGNRQKVSSFIDGQPMQGSQGNLQFQGIDAVEVYRGPQSAAFGRSTFAGAINYVTADAENEFGGQARVRLSDQGDKEVGLMLTGPLGDSLGYRLSYLKHEYTGPDDWVSTDGYEMNTQETDQFTGKLNFDFSENVYGEVMYSRLESGDLPGTNYVLEPGECEGDSGIFRNARGSSTEQPSGAWDCNHSVPAAGIPRNHDLLGQFLAQYDANIGFYTAAAPRADTNGDGSVSSSEYLAQTLADGVTYEQAILRNTIDNPSTDNIRNRLQGEINIEVGDNLLQVMAMYVEETVDNWRDNDGGQSIAVFAPAMNRAMTVSLGRNTRTRGQHNDIEENYAEVRWISPAENRLRYTLAGSWYDYSIDQAIYEGKGALVYGLTFPDGSPVDPINSALISEVATNVGISASVQYDLTDRTTLSRRCKGCERRNMQGDHRIFTPDSDKYRDQR